ncbi:hypothetical protein F4604DRAFT_319397 [Suillus subluteus]|nr:hypothetical protein F4604DRAFT_319397 [Suillus subluteus]
MSTTITPEEIQAWDLDFLNSPTIKYITIAALTLFTWDLILTLPHEFRLWNAKWTFAKVLFFVNRYFALGTAILITFLIFDVTPTWALCSANTFFAVIALLLVANIEMILQLRLYALYAYDKRIVLTVSALFVAVFSGMMVMAVFIHQYEKNYKAQIFGACAIVGVPLMGLDSVLVLLAGYKSLQHYFQVPDKTWFGARLMRAFARDSILYFLCNFLIYLLSTVLGKYGPAEYYQLSMIMVTIVPPISANRLLINMYDFAHTEQDRGTTRSDVRIHPSPMYWPDGQVLHKDIELVSINMEDATIDEWE